MSEDLKKTSIKKRTLKRTQSLPSKTKSKMLSTDSSEKRNRLAQTLYGTFKEPHQIEMENIRKLADTKIVRDEDGKRKLKYTSTLPLTKRQDQWIEEKKKVEADKQDYAIRKTKEIMDNPLDTVSFHDIPAIHDDPMPLLNRLNCNDRLNWCMSQGPGVCAPGTLIEQKYTYACKIYNYIEKRIKEDIIGLKKPNFDREYFEDMMLETEVYYENIMNLPLKTYIECFSSYGNGIAGYEFYIQCDFYNNRILLLEDQFEELFEFQQRLVYIKNNMWSEEDFMHAVENFITVDVIKQIYQDHSPIDPNMRGTLLTMNNYTEGSLRWWRSALRCESYPYPTPNTDVVDPKKFDILNELFRFDGLPAWSPGLFTGKCFEGVEGYNHLISGARENGPLIKDLINYFRDYRTRTKALGELLEILNHFRYYGRIRQNHLTENLVVEFMLEFFKLLSFSGGTDQGPDEWSDGYYLYNLTNDIEEKVLDYENNKKATLDRSPKTNNP
tara:strand:- start:157 stop:1650 length:1494 start_codon:yes stop_codon:yes gene_type:complete